MADGFEKAFQAFLQSKQTSDFDEDNESIDNEVSSADSESEDEPIKLLNWTTKTESSNNSDEEKYRSIPKLKLMVCRDQSSDQELSPFSLQTYINKTKLVNGTGTTNTCFLPNKYRGKELSNGTDHDTIPTKKLFMTINKEGKQLPSSKITLSYQKRLVLKKYGLLFPGRRCKHISGNLSPNQSWNCFSKNLSFTRLLNEDQVDGSVVDTTKCDSHYFGPQGECVSRNSPEVAKSAISSPATASTGESSVIDPSCVLSVTESSRNSQSSSPGMVDELHKTVSRSNHTQPLLSDTDSQSDPKNQKDDINAPLPNRARNSKKRKRFSDSNPNVGTCEHLQDETDEESACQQLLSSRKQRSRRKQSGSCLCCDKKINNHLSKSYLREDMLNFKHLSIRDQTFISCSIQLSNMKSKLHALFCCVFPKLVPYLHKVTPESDQFHQLVDDILEVLESADMEVEEDNTGMMVKLLNDMQLRHDSTVIPIYKSNVMLCQKPEYCLKLFRDKVVYLLQLLLPSLIISLDNLLSSTREVEKFIDKLISCN